VTLDDLQPEEANALRNRARAISRRIGSEVVVDIVRMKGDKIVATFRPLDGGFAGRCSAVLPTQAYANCFARRDFD
jgi:hypothetical protein